MIDDGLSRERTAARQMLVNRALARVELERRQRDAMLRGWTKNRPLLRTVPDALAPVFEIFDRIRRGEKVRALIQAAPRSYKTTACTYGALREMEKRPGFRFGYATYNMAQARKHSGVMRGMAETIGMFPTRTQVIRKSQFDTSKSLAIWQTGNGSQAEFMGEGNVATGQGYDLLHIDDPIKDENEGESPEVLADRWMWVLGSVFPRMEPGASVILSHHRWSIDDPIGKMLQLIEDDFPDVDADVRKLLGDKPWTVVDLPAMSPVSDTGDVDLINADLLIPEDFRSTTADGVRGKPWFTRVDLMQNAAESMDVFKTRFLQRPPRNQGRVFAADFPKWTVGHFDNGDEMGFEVLDVWYPMPKHKSFIPVFGVDTAGTESSTADWTAIVLIFCYWEWVPLFSKNMMHADVVACWTERLNSTGVVDFVASVVSCLPGTPVAFEDSGVGSPQLQFLKRDYPNINTHGMKVSTSKRVRALPAGNASKGHRVREPIASPWLKQWRRQVNAFTGFDGPVPDDLPDAFVHGWNYGLTQSPPEMPFAGGHDRRLVTGNF